MSTVQLTHYLLLLSPHWHLNTLNTKLADNAKSRRRASYMYRVRIFIISWKTKRAIQNSTKQNWKNKKNCYRYHSSSQRSLSPFWFQLLTIFSSFIGRDFYHRQLLVFRIVKIKIIYQQHKSCDSQTWYTFFCSNSIFHVHSWYSDLSLRLWGPWSLNVLTISLIFLWVRGPAHYENTRCYFSVGLPRTVCAFVSLTLHGILQQYVPRNTVAKLYPSCFFLLLWNYIIGYCHPARSFTVQSVSFGQWNVVG